MTPSFQQLAFITLRWLDVVDIILVAILLYQLYQLIKGTVAIRIFLGILFIYVFWKLVEAFQMELLAEILGQFIGVGVLALIIVFQQEIRRFLLLVGSRSAIIDPKLAKKWFKWSWRENEEVSLNINAITKACYNMSRNKTGALLVISFDTELKFHAATGESINAELSAPLLESIFFKNSPLHDGATIVHQNRITAARCILPVSDNPDIPANYGLRHRAAVGITENSTAVAIIVSEETGELAICHRGNIRKNVEVSELRSFLEEASFNAKS